MLSDLKGARRYLEEEYAAAEARDAELYENISDSVCRIDLSAWKYTGMPMEWLFRIFVASAGVRNQEGLFDQYLKEAGQAAEEGRLPFDAADWKRCLEEYGNLRRPVHHSPRYREAERPAYRLADRRYIRLLPVLEKAAQLSVPGQPCVIAIDGTSCFREIYHGADAEQDTGRIGDPYGRFLPAARSAYTQSVCTAGRKCSLRKVPGGSAPLYLCAGMFFLSYF